MKLHASVSKHDVSCDVNGKGFGEGDDLVVDAECNVCTAGACGAPPWCWLCALKSNARPKGSGASGHGGCTVSSSYGIPHDFNHAGIFC